MTETLRKLIHLIYRFSPKWNHAVIWGWPDYEDSVISMEKALQDSQVSSVILLMTDPSCQPSWTLGPKTTCVTKNSLAGWLLFCSAKYVFFTHRCFMRRFPANVISVNIWHGMPIKKIGWMLDGDEGISAKYTLATSPFWAKIMDQSMQPHGELLSVGLPRNDRLFTPAANTFEKLNLSPETRLIAWLPTYRQSVRGDLRTDGRESGNVFEMPDLDPDQLNEFLRTRDTILVVKPHPMAVFNGTKSWSHLWIVDDAWLREHSLSLYEFLGATTSLISDISSVVIDYLLLDRPIIHAFSDLEAYQNSRGFSIEPITDYLMGPVVTTAAELETAIAEVLDGTDSMKEKRHAILQLSHSHRDSNATQRLLNAIGVTTE